MPDTRPVLFTDGTTQHLTPDQIPHGLPELADHVARALGVAPEPRDRSTMRLSTMRDPGPVQTFWSGDGLRGALKVPRGRALLSATRPRAVMAHGGPSDMLDSWTPRSARARDPHGSTDPSLVVFAREVRAIAPDAALWCGLGMDGIAHRILSREWTQERAIQRVLDVCDMLDDLGGEALMFDPEAAYKQTENSPAFKALHDFIVTLLRECRAKYPRLVLLHTAYDHPLYHPQDRNPNRPDDPGVYDWQAWCGDEGVDGEFFQVYAGDDDGDPTTRTGYRGALARFARHQEQVKAAVARGWLRADLADNDLNAGMYLQTHSVTTSGTVALGSVRRWTCGWATPTRLDDPGVDAWRVLDTLSQQGLLASYRSNAMNAWQTKAKRAGQYQGDVDNVCGPKTLAAFDLPPLPTFA